MPGLEARLPLLFDAMVSQGRLGLEKFVALSATEPAKIYGLHPRKGEIVIGSDADIAIWDPNRKVTIGAALGHDLTGYSPYEGRTVTGWPVTVLSRGRVVVDDTTLRVAPGSGRFLARDAGTAAVPTGRRGPEFDPAQNFGAFI
jgi:dihydropyrimidinase